MYTAEEMPYEHHEHSAWSIFVVRIEALESVRLLVRIEDRKICDFF